MLVLTLLVRDEEDILEANIDFHLSMGVDLVIVTDHRSVDATPEILERYERHGYVLVIREEAQTYEQARWVTKMARMAHALGASWVINGDADEFWWPAEGSLPTSLATVPALHDVVTVHRTDFPPPADEIGPFWERMVYREIESRNLLGEPLPPKVCHRARPDVNVAQGNHSVVAERLGPALDDGRIEILHFPLRTYRQFERKIMSGGAAYEAPGSPSTVGGTWRHAYRLWQKGELRGLFDSRVLTAPRLSERLAAGTIVRDTRLKSALERLRSSGATVRPLPTVS